MNPPTSASDDSNIPATCAASIPPSIPPSTLDDPRDSPRWLAVYVIVRHPGRAPYWLSVGKAFVNADGSLNVRLDANPIDGKLHIRRPPTRESPGAANHAATETSTADATTARPRTDATKRPLSTKRGGR